MKKYIPFFLLLLSSLELYAQAVSSPKPYAAKSDAAYSLKEFDVREAYQLSAKETVVIAMPTKANPTDEGLRLLYLLDKKMAYQSKGVEESYIYEPTFLQFADSSLLILCESGTEYSWGVDVFQLRQQKVTYLGHLNLAGDQEEAPLSIVPQTKVERRGKNYIFTFTGKVVVDPGEEGEKVIAGNSIQAIYQETTGTLTIQKK